MSNSVNIVGAGIAGLSCGIGLAQRGISSQIIDQSQAPQPLGAGIQLGPNAVRLLDRLGLADPLRRTSFMPQALRIRRLDTERTLARLELGEAFAQRYGAPYLTIHRADLHRLLLDRCEQLGIDVQWGRPFEPSTSYTIDPSNPAMSSDHQQILVGADGVWSRVRQHLPKAHPPATTGHVALRGQLADPLNVRSELGQEITVWVSSHLHVVGYPILAGRAYGLVMVTPAAATLPMAWDHLPPTDQVTLAATKARGILGSLLRAVDDWSSWPLYACPPVQSAAALAHDRVALIGDAAHAMRPHMAQGAAMGIEDAWVLADCLATSWGQPVEALQQYAELRAGRVARVQIAAQRAGAIFQWAAPMSWGRNLALAALGGRLLDQPWLYAGGPCPPAVPRTSGRLDAG